MQKYYDQQPIIICGAHGGGTSYITKLLRWSGLFVGDDAGSKYDRKCHESNIFYKTNCDILIQLTGDNEMMKEASWVRYDKIIRKKGLINKICSSLDLERILNQYWNDNPRNKIWGFKDPRNTATLPIWLEIFPKAKILVIHRKWREGLKPSKFESPSGKWFKELSTPVVREKYNNPPFLKLKNNIDRHDIFFDEAIKDYKKFNNLLKWVGLPEKTEKEFKDLLNITKIERTEINS